MRVKTMINKRNIIIIVLCATIITMAIAFSYLTMQLNLQKTKQFYHDVSIEKVESLTPIQGGHIAPSASYQLSNSNKTIDMQFGLTTPRDEVSYKIVIKNKGTHKAKIVSIIETPDFYNKQSVAQTILPAIITHNNINETVLKPGEEISLTVIAYLPSSAPTTVVNVSYQLSILSESIVS